MLRHRHRFPTDTLRRRALRAMACPPALVIVLTAHVLIWVIYGLAYWTSGNLLYLELILPYTMLAGLELWKIYDVFWDRSETPIDPAH